MKDTKQEKINDQIEKVKETLHNLTSVSNYGMHNISAAQRNRAKKLCDELIEQVPEFMSYRDFGVIGNNGQEDPFSQFGIFGRFVVETIQHESHDESLIRRIFQFVNIAYNENNDNYIRSILDTEVIENLTVSRDTESIGKVHLTGLALAQLEKMIVSEPG